MAPPERDPRESSIHEARWDRAAAPDVIDLHVPEPDRQTALEMAERVAGFVGEARRSLDLAVITAGPILGTLAVMAAEARVDVRGVVDRTPREQRSTIPSWRTASRPS
jgi:hypothetical protein